MSFPGLRGRSIVMTSRDRLVSNALGLVGAAAGWLLGSLAFGWAYNHGYYAGMLPGGLLGLGCTLLARHASFARGIVCGFAALVLGILNEWWYCYFVADPGLGYFLSHLGDVSQV